MRAAKTALGRLIRVGGRADGNVVFPIDAPELLAHPVRRRRFGVNLVFEILDIQLHVLVGVAGIAIFAAELAAAIRVDGPLERHVRLGAVENAARRDFKVGDPRFGLQQLTLGGEPCDAY